MSEPFVATLRTPATPLVLPSAPGTPTVTVRVQGAEAWDAVKVVCPATAPVRALKAAAMPAFYPADTDPAEVVVKFRGAEVRDEGESVGAAGARDGSTFFLAVRRRRPVR